MWREALEVANRDGLSRGQYFNHDGSVCLVGAVARACGVQFAGQAGEIEDSITPAFHEWLGNGRLVTPSRWFDLEASDEDALLFLKHMAYKEELNEV